MESDRLVRTMGVPERGFERATQAIGIRQKDGSLRQELAEWVLDELLEAVRQSGSESARRAAGVLGIFRVLGFEAEAEAEADGRYRAVAGDS